MKTTSFRPFLLGLLLLGITSCQKEISSDEVATVDNTEGRNSKHTVDIDFYALRTDNKIEKLNTLDPEDPIQTLSITGLQAGESVLAIDIRPATGQLYALGSSSRIYTVDMQTGAATAIGSGAFSPALSGSIAGFDFNPTVDRIRIISSTGQNLRAHPVTGLIVAVDGMINGTPGASITGAGYTNSRAGATTTTLYDLDVSANKLYIQNPPNNGTLVEVGTLDIEIEGEGGFDIEPFNTAALGLYEVNGKPTLFLVDLQTAGTIIIEKFRKTTQYRGLAILP